MTQPKNGDGADKKNYESVKNPDQILVTRAILDEVKQYISPGIPLSDDYVLSWMRRMTGRVIMLVENLPEDEEIVVICSLVPVVPGSQVAQCSECGVTIYHSRNAPPNSRKICTRCGPRLGH